MTKQCSKCGKVKPLDEFQKRARNVDGHTGMCKPCKRDYDNEHYKTHPERKQYIRDNSFERIKQNRTFLLAYLQEHPCVDCGETDPVVLEFDHRGDKEGNISVMVTNNSIPSISKEIEKCDVRCANCHRRKTARDFGFWKLNLE